MKLRVGRLRWLARYFEQHPKEYDQLTYCSPFIRGIEICGTRLCIGGLTVWQWGTDEQRAMMEIVLRGGTAPDEYHTINFSEEGARILGLTLRQRCNLFSGMPNWLYGVKSSPDRADRAATVLRHLARTGEVLGAPEVTT